MIFKNGIIHDVFIRELVTHKDDRGWLIELFRIDEIAEKFLPVMSYISQTKPGVVRGPHEHKDQADVFCFIGPSTFSIYLWDSRPSSPTFQHKMKLEAGEGKPQLIIVPAGVVHAYKNIGKGAGWVINLPNRLYAGKGHKETVDEIRHENDSNSPYNLD